jgi:hypothetical protein
VGSVIENGAVDISEFAAAMVKKPTKYSGSLSFR